MAKTLFNLIADLANEDGLTLKKGRTITYKTGYQVATEGIEVRTIEEAVAAIQNYDGSCGVWFFEGVYYIDKSKRVSTRCEAIAIGTQCNQTSILRWSDMSLIYL